MTWKRVVTSRGADSICCWPRVVGLDRHSRAGSGAGGDAGDVRVFRAGVMRSATGVPILDCVMRLDSHLRAMAGVHDAIRLSGELGAALPVCLEVFGGPPTIPGTFFLFVLGLRC